MCGLTGYWTFQDSDTHLLTTTVKRMTSQLLSRGPDSEGIWVESKNGLALGHRRLAIMDLSAAGHQPMQSSSGRYAIVYNGEIYNSPDLREILLKEGYSFRGHSDTEVILAACEEWGILKTCQQLIGIFAFALWDTQAQSLTLARDQMGVKPLYWGFQNGVLFFGSQLKSFYPHENWQGKIDNNALASYFRYNYVPAPFSIYQNIEKLEPAHLLVIKLDKTISKVCYWNFPQVVEQGLAQSVTDKKTDLELTDELDHLLTDAIGRQMLSDVPLGVFLSGGIDSSTVAAIMQKKSSRPIKTFSIGFKENGYDEAVYAKEVAKHLGTEHHELYLSEQDAQSIIPNLPQWYDEPFADVSQIPTYLVSKMAREQVTVALSGDGGDELFAGYHRYFLGEKIWRYTRKIPQVLRRPLSDLIKNVSPDIWDKLGSSMLFGRMPQLGDKAHKAADLLKAGSPQQIYNHLVSLWEDPYLLISAPFEPRSIEPAFARYANDDFVSFMQATDTVTYLPDDILTKVDRASMAVSLEARVPLLDHRLVEWAWTLPRSSKIRGHDSKWLLRQVLKRYVPANLFERPKMGFGVPIGSWLRGALKEWAEDLLTEQALKKNGLNAAPIRQRWHEHLTKRRNWQYSLWGVLMYQLWRQRGMKKND